MKKIRRIAALLALPAFYGYRNVHVYYDMSKLMPQELPSIVANNMPPTTATPIPLRAAEPAPAAIANGKQPIMNANEVIKIGRKRKPAASSAALIGSMPLSTRTLANSTINMPFFAPSPITMIIAICM